MIIGECFPEDNLTVARYQHDVYMLAVRIIVDLATEIYLDHSNKVGLNDEFSDFLGRQMSFDHRPFQYFHDLIAAYYRYRYCRQYVLPLEGLVSPQSKQEWQDHWLIFLKSEMVKLLENGFAFDLASLALLYHTEYGYIIEERLMLKLADRYLEETQKIDGKGVDLLDEKLRGELIKSLQDEPILDRKGVLELVHKNKDLIVKRVSRS